jgi:hypothetical protein
LISPTFTAITSFFLPSRLLDSRDITISKPHKIAIFKPAFSLEPQFSKWREVGVLEFAASSFPTPLLNPRLKVQVVGCANLRRSGSSTFKPTLLFNASFVDIGR